MDLYLISASKHPDITKPWLDRVAEAIEFQLYQHVAPFWQISGVRVFAVESMDSMPTTSGASPLVIYDTPDQAGFLGWHTYNAHEGVVHGTVYVDPILAGGNKIEDIPVTISHEAIEAVLDPYVNNMVFKDDSTLEPVEGCDRVQGDTYDVGGTLVSNFLGPRAFRDGPGPYDWLRKLSGPWDMTPGGYCMRFDVRQRKWNTLWGATIPQWRKDLVQAKLDAKLSRLARHVQRAG